MTMFRRNTFYLFIFGLLTQSSQATEWTAETIRDFGFVNSSMVNPAAGLIEGANGQLYGTSENGGSHGQGSVFTIDANGENPAVILNFGSSPNDGRNPQASVVFGTDGRLYGTTSAGGVEGAGTIYSLAPDGSNPRILWSFSGTSDSGSTPVAPLVEATDGYLYGTTRYGGEFGYGTLFKIGKTGNDLAIVRSFSLNAGGAWDSRAGLVEGTTGYIYGTTSRGGAFGNGTVFRVAKDGSQFSILHDFSGGANDGAEPLAALCEGNDQLLYGTCASGGSSGSGTVFRIAQDGSAYQMLRQFTSNFGDGQRPLASLIQGTDGSLFGTTVDGGTNLQGTVFRVDTDGGNFQVIHHFLSGGIDGIKPFGAVLESSKGTLFGTTHDGGKLISGSIFRLAKDGSQYQMTESPSPGGGDGISPIGRLFEGSDGKLYGTTHDGGTASFGTAFAITKEGSNYQVLHNFSGLGSDGAWLSAGLLEGSDGKLYGTTTRGGNYDAGILFQLTKVGGDFNVIRSFSPISQDGRSPYAEVMEAADGNLYGTASSGGANGQGTLFRISKNGSGFLVIKNFGDGTADAKNPYAPVVQTGSGMLVGTSRNGGGPGHGTIYEVSTSGANFGILHEFQGSTTDGIGPEMGLFLASDGILYGTTPGGGSLSGGTVFRVSSDGTGYTLLHSFEVFQSAYYPNSAVTEGNDGYLYGTTSGGTDGYGAVYRLGKDGSDYAVIRTFSYNGGEGTNPSGGLILASNGWLIGVTTAGGFPNLGTIYEIAPKVVLSNVSTPTPPGTTLFLNGLPDWSYHVEASSTIYPPSWSSLNDITFDRTGSTSVLDSGSSGQSKRFYRFSPRP